MGGRILKQHHSQGPLDPGRSTPPHQLPGVSGSHPLPSGSLPPTELSYHDQVRQHGGGLPDQQKRIQQSRNLSHLLQDLSLCNLHSWTLRTSYLPGHLNAWADSLSRNHPIKVEWSLSQRSFHQLTARTAEPQIELFTHRGNTKLPIFGCPFSFPTATVVDALTADCKRILNDFL